VTPDAALTAAVADLREVVRDLRSVVESLRPGSAAGGVDLLNFDDVARTVGVSPRTLRRLRSRRDFPKPIRGPGPLRWRRRDIQAYLESAR
jgi:predicted DNA-binding transcriptional regulator AlpA